MEMYSKGVREEISQYLLKNRDIAENLKSIFRYHKNQIRRDILLECNYINKEGSMPAMVYWLMLHYVDKVMKSPNTTSVVDFINDIIKNCGPDNDEIPERLYIPTYGDIRLFRYDSKYMTPIYKVKVREDDKYIGCSIIPREALVPVMELNLKVLENISEQLAYIDMDYKVNIPDLIEQVFTMVHIIDKYQVLGRSACNGIINHVMELAKEISNTSKRDTKKCPLHILDMVQLLDLEDKDDRIYYQQLSELYSESDFS